MRITIDEVHTDDWHVIYINNEKAFEGHDVDIHSIVEELQNLITHNGDVYKQPDHITSISSEYYYINEDYAESNGFPNNFTDIPAEMFE